MNTKQLNWFRMSKSVIKVLEQYILIVNTLPALLAAYNLCKMIIQQIETIMQQQSMSIKGITAGKNESKKSLAHLANYIAAAVYAYASTANNMVLIQEMKFSKSGLMRMSDEELPQAALGIYDRAGANLAALADYGVDANLMQIFQQTIATYSSLVENPVAARSHSSTNTKLLEQNLAKLRDVLINRIDKTMEILQDSQTELYLTFKSARKIIDSGRRHTSGALQPTDVKTGSVAVNVYDADTGQPIEGANIKVVDKDIELETDEDGQAYGDQIPAGSYDIEIRFPGYETGKIIAIEVPEGDEVQKDIQLKVSSPSSETKPE